MPDLTWEGAQSMHEGIRFPDSARIGMWLGLVCAAAYRRGWRAAVAIC